MKTLKIVLTLIIVCMLCLGCCSCAKAPEDAAPSGADSGNLTEGSDPADSFEESSAEEPSSETAMENFVRKLSEGNYVIDADGFMKTTVCSPDLVYYSYYDEAYDDYALITLDQETFFGILGDDTVSEVVFASADDAVRTASYTLPNCWMTISDGNMFNLFYNNVEKPLEFVSYEDSVKTTLMTLAGYGGSALNLMHEVYMTLDAEDPTTVRFTAVVDDNPVARIFYDDLDLTLQFGAAESDPRVDRWLDEPVYPETRSNWNDDDLFYLNSVFFPGYGQDAIPFPRFASYALTLDEDVFNQTETILYTDAHGTESDLEDYISELLADGFLAVEEQLDDGSIVTVYRRALREDYRCYVSVYPYIDNGFVLEAEKYYDNPKYDSLPDINEILVKNGFAALPDHDHFSEWFAEDTACENSESWLYFFDYDICLNVMFCYDDGDELKAYLADYGDLLAEMGYSMSSNTGEEDGAGYGQYSSGTGTSVFKYSYGDIENTAYLLFRNEKSISPEEAVKMIADAGIPAADLHGDIVCRDIAGYHRMTRAFDGRIYLSVSQPFDSAEEADAFLSEYTARLEDAGFYRTDPAMVGTLKQNAYYNEDEDQFVSFDFIDDSGDVSVNFDFVSNS